MSRIEWSSRDNISTGLDRGVLYTSYTAVPWNGLVEVKIAPRGGSVENVWQDGISQYQASNPTYFSAELTAFSSPPEFDQYDGGAEFKPGLRIENREVSPDVSFDLTYRTGFWQESHDETPDYQIHVLKYMVARPLDSAYNTISTTTEPTLLSWELAGRMLTTTGLRPMCYFIIDTKRISPAHLVKVENALYGTETTDPETLRVSELMSLDSIGL